MKDDFIGYWRHNTKFNSKPFKGAYERDKDDERVFVLRAFEGKRKVTFESWQMAKKLNWNLNKG